MLNELSCFYFDWVTVGTWVGGVGTAGAALWGVFSVRKAWAMERSRNITRAHVLMILISPEIGFASGAAEQILVKPEMLTDKSITAYWRENLSLVYMPQLLALSGDLDQDLAFALAQSHMYVMVLDKYLMRWESGSQSSEAAGAIKKAAAALKESTKKLMIEFNKAQSFNKDLMVRMCSQPL